MAVTPTADRSSSEPGGSGDAPSEPNAAVPITAATLGSPLTLAGDPIPPGGEEVGFVTWDIPTGSTPSRLQHTTDNGFGPQTGEWTL